MWLPESKIDGWRFSRIDPQSVDFFLCGSPDQKSVAGDFIDPQGVDYQSLVCDSHSVGFQTVVTLTMPINLVEDPLASRVSLIQN